MKIGIDCRFYSPKFTGIGRYTYELVRHFIKFNRAQGSPHEFVLFFNRPEYSQFMPPPGIKKVLVNSKHYSLKEQTTFCRKLYKEKLDLMFFPHFNVPILYRRPYIVTIHDLTLSLFPGKKMTKFYHRLAYQLTIRNAIYKSRKIISVSKNTKQDLINHLRAPYEKINVIYNGLSPEFQMLPDATKANRTLKKYGIKKEFLLYTGVWRSHKNLPRLVKALKLLQEEYNIHIQLVITGKPDPHYPELKRTVKEFNLKDQVVFPGLVSDKELIYLYNAAHIYAFPSLYEGFGLPPLEAMACGTPVAASNTSCIPEICKDKAIYFDPENPYDIAKKIANLYKDLELQTRLITEGIAHSKKFSWHKTAQQTYDLITTTHV